MSTSRTSRRAADQAAERVVVVHLDDLVVGSSPGRARAACAAIAAYPAADVIPPAVSEAEAALREGTALSARRWARSLLAARMGAPDRPDAVEPRILFRDYEALLWGAGLYEGVHAAPPRLLADPGELDAERSAVAATDLAALRPGHLVALSWRPGLEVLHGLLRFGLTEVFDAVVTGDAARSPAGPWDHIDAATRGRSVTLYSSMAAVRAAAEARGYQAAVSLPAPGCRTSSTRART